MDFNRAAEILHDVDAAVQETAVKQDISGRSLHANAVERRLDHLHVAADGAGFQLSRAARTHKRTINRLDHHVAIHIGKLQVGADGIESHIAMHAFDVDIARVGPHAQLALDWNRDFKIRLDVGRGDILIGHVGYDFNAIPGLFGFDDRFAARVCPSHLHFTLVPSLHLNLSTGIAHGNHGLALHGEVFFDAISLRGRCDEGKSSHYRADCAQAYCIAC